VFVFEMARTNLESRALSDGERPRAARRPNGAHPRVRRGLVSAGPLVGTVGVAVRNLEVDEACRARLERAASQQVEEQSSAASAQSQRSSPCASRHAE
jgi:hypothetical protein